MSEGWILPFLSLTLVPHRWPDLLHCPKRLLGQASSSPVSRVSGVFLGNRVGVRTYLFGTDLRGVGRSTT